MPHQLAVTVRAPIAPGRKADVVQLLSDINRKGAASGPLPFAEMEGVHFARLFVIDDATDLEGRSLPASLVYMADIDAPLGRHWGELAAKAGPGLDEVFGRCADYPTEPVTPGARTAWLRGHSVASGAVYVNTVGRGLQQIRGEAWLREAIEDFLDDPSVSRARASATEVRAAVREFVASRPDLAWALRPPSPPSLGFRLREAAHKVCVPLVALLLSPLLLLALPVWGVLLRTHERRDAANRERPSLEHVRMLDRYEDHATQNPFTAVGLVKGGWFRQLTIRAVLYATNYGTRHLFARGNLAGVKTIHFARWVSIDDRRRVIFVSNYDGSLESYMDDFIDKVAWGLNAVFSNGSGYPATRWLVLDGAKDEQAFKNYLRRGQLPTQVWYSAYDTLTAHNVATNASLRAGLWADLTPDQTRDWLTLL